MRCYQCEDFELRRDHPVSWGFQKCLLVLLPKPRSSMISAVGASMALVMGAATGRAEPTHYERHRREYERTGDRQELDRMLRQVRDASR